MDGCVILSRRPVLYRAFRQCPTGVAGGVADHSLKFHEPYVEPFSFCWAGMSESVIQMVRGTVDKERGVTTWMTGWALISTGPS